jgi:hypothetical protein
VQCEVRSHPIEVACLKRHVKEVLELMSIGKMTYYRGRLDENCRVIQVNLTMSVMAISREFEKFTYSKGFRGIEGRITEVLMY